MSGRTEKCYLCGGELKEGAACKNPNCARAWEAYEAPMREAPQPRPVARGHEGDVEAP